MEYQPGVFLFKKMQTYYMLCSFPSQKFWLKYEIRLINFKQFLKDIYDERKLPDGCWRTFLVEKNQNYMCI